MNLHTAEKTRRSCATEECALLGHTCLMYAHARANARLAVSDAGRLVLSHFVEPVRQSLELEHGALLLPPDPPPVAAAQRSLHAPSHTRVFLQLLLQVMGDRDAKRKTTTLREGTSR